MYICTVLWWRFNSKNIYETPGQAFVDVQTCNYGASTVYLHKILFSEVAKLRLLGLLSDIAYWKDMCQIKDTHAIE